MICSPHDRPAAFGSMKGYEMETAMNEVTQADRDIANSVWLDTTSKAELARKIARHRTTAEAAKDARIKELEAHIEGLNAIVESAQRAALQEIDNG